MARFAALLDANVLVPVSLADTLLRIAAEDLYRPIWSEQILTEVATALRRVHPEVDGIERRVNVMREFFPDALTAGWQPLVNALDLPDPDDRHVLAAAVVGRADVIVTNNVKDFPPASVEPFDIEVQRPDEFLCNQLDLAPNTVMNLLAAQAAALTKSPLTVPELLASLERAGAPSFALEARQQLWRLKASSDAPTIRRRSGPDPHE